MKKSLQLGLILAATTAASQVKAQVALPFLEDFSATSSTTTQWDFTNPSVIVVVNTDVSAYDIGEGSLMYNFYNSAGNSNYNVQSPIIANPSKSGLKLSFDFAAAVRYTMPVALPQDFALDYIYLEYSKDSGATWTLYDTMRIGTNGPLNTYGGTGISPNMIFTPNSTQWTSIGDIKLPSGTNKVAFRGVRYNNINGNFAYLDNVSIDTCYTPQPVADTIQYDAAYTTVADLIATGTGLNWYSDADGMNQIGDTTALADSTYYYVSQTLNGCESAPLGIWFGDTSTTTEPPVDTGNSVKTLEVFKNVKIYPNPTADHISIDADLKITAMVLTDVLGKKIMDLKADDRTINVSHLPSGLYILNITAQDVSQAFKLTKL